MSVDFSIEISSSGDRHTTICLGGSLTEEELKRIEPDVREAIERHDQRHGVLWDLRKVRRIDLGARQTMQRIQSDIASRQLRTAYIASRPRIRGIALWIVHTSGDTLSRPFAKQHQAVDWLDESIGRVEQLNTRSPEIAVYAEKRRRG